MKWSFPWKKNTIQMKLLSSTMLTVSVTILTCFLSISVYLEPYLRSIFAKDTLYAVQSSSHQLSYYLDEVITYSSDISFNALIQEIYTTDLEPDTYPYFRLLFDVEQYLDQYIILHDNILFDIFLLDEHGNPMEVSQKYGGITATPVYKDLIRPEVKSGLSMPHQVAVNKDLEMFQVIAYVCNINNASAPSQFLGKIVILIKYDELVKPLENIGNHDSLILLNEKNQVIYPCNSAIIQEKIPAYQVEEPLGIYGWKLRGTAQNKHIYESVFGIFRILFAIMLVFSCFALFAAYITTRKIIHPLNTLIRAMKEVSAGNQQVQVRLHSNDEIQEAAHVFNRMVQDINAYTEEIICRDKREHEITMQMLIYQINPHFISNTLNCIICLARKKDYGKIIELTKIFIMLLQVTLRTTPKTMAAIAEEITHINHYVSILQYSYDDISPIQWAVDPLAKELKIPRLLLYPLVENSIFHGILTADHPCKIEITIQLCDGGYEVIVEDNGRGISPEKLAAIIDSLHTEKTGQSHIGLQNVNNRLRLLYGSDALLSLESWYEKGTRIRFQIPILP